MGEQSRVRKFCSVRKSTVAVTKQFIISLCTRSAPTGATAFDVRGTPGVDVYIVHNPQVVKVPSCVPRWPLDARVEVVVTMEMPSNNVNDDKVMCSFSFVDFADISLDADITRSGTVKRGTIDKKNWTWGPDGHGAVLLVNCDRDNPDSTHPDNADFSVRCYADLKDMSLMILTAQGPEAVFADHKLVLHVSKSDADKVGVFHSSGNGHLCHFEHVLGSDELSYVVERDSGQEETIFYVEGLAFPDADFSGLVSFHVTLMDVPAKNLPETPIFTDTVVFRVAPWIMTPNILQPLEVFVCSTSDNVEFVAAVAKLTKKSKCKLIICPELENRGDRWIQDEMEFGYVQAPHKAFPVVFDSPRNGQLKDFPFKSILVGGFIYLLAETSLLGSSIPAADLMDEFGEVTVNLLSDSVSLSVKWGQLYVLSLLFSRTGGRRMTKVVKDFLCAQQVQSPVELFADWLYVGHVDEFMSFVPAPGRQGFRLLLASPSACYQLFKEKQEEGYGDAVMFEGKMPFLSLLTRRGASPSCIDWNRDILKRELGLTERDIIDIPQLFRLLEKEAHAFFPDMVNMLVLGKHLGIPKPFGPIIKGKCCLEAKVRSLLEPLGLACTFINDYFSYHLYLGEVHCGTNARRKPFSFKWWNMSP
uniref:Protein-arginine deiminase n=1 Tax=Sphenodon punctatus TaxID=8508 RepID=A0A8D0GRS1_SPHPU